MGRSPLALAFALLVAAGCKHDLEPLSAEYEDVREPIGGSSGKQSTSGKGGGGGRGGSAGSTETDGGRQCECDELSDAAKALGLRACCRGLTGDECGITFGQGTVCLPRMVPGQMNDTCGELRIGDMEVPGCCRPDGRCGVAAEGLGFGCVAREEIGPLLPGSAMPEAVACNYTCDVDQDCRAVLRGLVCAETRDHSARYCVQGCQADEGCRRGTICTLSNDRALNRVLAICDVPIGEGRPGEPCMFADDCVHAVCSKPIGSDARSCSQLCRSTEDCPMALKSCKPTSIASPMDGGMPLNLSICVP